MLETSQGDVDEGCNTMLFNGLPCVKDLTSGKWILFSPYLQKKVVLTQEQHNDAEFVARLESILPGFFQRPKSTVNDYSESYSLVLSLTEACNLRCTYCFLNGGECSRTMTEEVLISNINAALKICSERKKQSLTISFFGGEPTLCPELLKKAVSISKAQAKELPFPLHFNITTNGVIKEDVLRFLRENKFSISLSMDGLPFTQDAQRPLASGMGSSRFVERTIRVLAEANQAIKVRCTITEKNVSEMPAIVLYLATLGCKRVQFEVVTESGRAKSSGVCRPSRESFVQYLLESIDTAAKVGMEVLNSSFMRLFTPAIHYCDGMAESRRIVNPDGTISTCVEVNSSNHKAAEYFLLQSQSDVPLTAIRPIAEHSKDCSNCFAKFICGGGCPSRNYHCTGSAYVPDEFRCYVVKNIVPLLILRG